MFGWKNGEFPPDAGAATQARPDDPAKSNWPGHACVTGIRHSLPLGLRAAVGLRYGSKAEGNAYNRAFGAAARESRAKSFLVLAT